MQLHRIIWILAVLLIVGGCRKTVTVDTDTIPEHFDNVVYPKENAYSDIRWELGKRLFYDKRMSVDSSVSCASCHKPELAFSDNVAQSIGAGGKQGKRNAPTLTNVAYHPYFTREGSLPTLEMQVLVPLQEHDEFNLNILILAERLKEDSIYVQLCADAYDREIDPFCITRALATFERSLISSNSPYDRYLQKTIELTASQKMGMELFFSDRAQCATCHSGFNFTSYAFENNGLYTAYADDGRYRFTGKTHDKGRFKIATLRNLSYTAPYMHDGSMTRIRDVLHHYNKGGENHPQKSPLIRPLHLTTYEIEALESFLLTLDDPHFVSDPTLRPD